MPRAVDPPGRYPTADMDPAQRADQTLNIATFPGFDWIGWFIGELRKIVHSIISFLIKMIAFFTGGLIDLTPIHEIIDEIIDSIIADLGTGENLLKLWRVIVSIIETATGVNLTRVFMELLPAVIAFMNDLVEIAGSTGALVSEVIAVPLNILRQLGRVFSGEAAVLDAIPEAFQPIINAFTTWWSEVAEHLPSAINQAAQAIWYFAELLYNTGTANIAGLAQAITAGADAVIGILQGAGITVYENLQQAGAQLGGLINAARDAADTVAGQITALLNATGAASIQALADLINTIRGLIETIISALTAGGTGFAQGLEHLGTALAQIPNSIQAIIDSSMQAIFNAPNIINQSIESYRQGFNQLAGFLGFAGAGGATSVNAITLTNNQFITRQADHMALKGGVDPTVEGPFDISTIMQSATLPSHAVTSANEVYCFVPTIVGATEGDPNPARKTSVRWLGYPTGGNLNAITGIYLDVYEIDTDTGVSTLVYASPNVAGSTVTGTAFAWNAHNFVASGFRDGRTDPAHPLYGQTYFETTQERIYLIGFRLFGTGTYNIVGQVNNLPPLEAVIPAKFGAQRQNIAFQAVGSGPTTGTGNYTIPQGGYVSMPAINITADTTCLVLAGGIAGTAASGGHPMPASAFTVRIGVPGAGGAELPNAALTTFPAFPQTYQGFWVLFINQPGLPQIVGPTTVTIQCTGPSGAWNASLAVLSYVGPTRLNPVPWINNGTSAAPQSGAFPAMEPNSMTIGTISGHATLNGNGPGVNSRGGTNAGGTFPTWVWDQLNAGVGGYNYSTTMGSAPWGSLVIQLFCDPPTVFAKPAIPPAAALPLAYHTNTPWLGLAGQSGDIAYPPTLLTYDTLGSYSEINPAVRYPWANYFDLVWFAAGGGGGNGAVLASGNGGMAGGAGARTLSKAEMGQANLTLIVGAGGAAAAQGGGSSIVVPGTTTSSAPGGAGANPGQGIPGASRANIVWTDARGNARTYFGGGGGGSAQALGGRPGGGGAGGNATIAGQNIYGGNGGHGIVYILAYQ